VQGPEDALAVAVQAVFIDFRVVAHDIAQRGEAAVVHVGRGVSEVAQAGHLEFAEVAMLGPQVARCRGVFPGRIVVVAAEQVVGVGQQRLMPPWLPGSTPSGLMKKGTPMSPNSPLLNSGPAWQVAHCPRPKTGADRVVLRGMPCDGCVIAAQERVAQGIEGRGRRDQGFLPGGDRLGRIHQESFVASIGARAKGLPVQAVQSGLAAQ
jgi:hypothetical protein